MAIVFALANRANRKQFRRKSRSSKQLENQDWLKAAQQISRQIGIQGQMALDDFELVLDLYPERRTEVYSSRTNQPAPGGLFKGLDYNPEMGEEMTIWIYRDQENDHYRFIENMQAYSRSFNAYRGHQFCAKCCGWVTKLKLHAHRCIYEFWWALHKQYEQPDVSDVQSVVRIKHPLDSCKKRIWFRVLVQSASHA